VQIEGYWASLDLPRLVYSPLAHSHLKQQPPNSQAAKVAFAPPQSGQPMRLFDCEY
jgi:hypothetical protein